MIVRFNFERAGPAISNVDDAGIFARPLQHQFAARGQTLQVNARRFIGTMLAPHHAEDAESSCSPPASTAPRSPAPANLCRAAPIATPPTADRKSTRLNSSHLGISYAVFC